MGQMHNKIMQLVIHQSVQGQPSYPFHHQGKWLHLLPNFNIGMDLWNGSPAGGVTVKGRPATVPQDVAPHGVVGREGLPPEQMWINDERELKRQRKKQSNHESARRSRLRKQAEYEELAAKAEALSNDNQTLRTELQRLAEKCEKRASENKSMTSNFMNLINFPIVTQLISSIWCYQNFGTL